MEMETVAHQPTRPALRDLPKPLAAERQRVGRGEAHRVFGCQRPVYNCPQRPYLPGRRCAGSESRGKPIRRQSSSDTVSGLKLLSASATADRRRVLVFERRKAALLLPAANCAASTSSMRCPESVVGNGSLMANRIRREHAKSRAVSSIQSGNVALRTSSATSLRWSLLPTANGLRVKKCHPSGEEHAKCMLSAVDRMPSSAPRPRKPAMRICVAFTI